MQPTIKLNGKEYPLITPDLLTLGEAADAEAITGQGYDLFAGGARGLLALTYISVRRVDPSVELEDIRMMGGDEIEVQLEAEPVPLASSADSDASGEPSTESSATGSDESAPTPEPSGTPV